MLCGQGRKLGAVPGHKTGVGQLRELIRTNDMVLMSAVGALLDGAGIQHMLLDQNMSVLDGSVGAIPRRLVVPDDQLAQARELLREAGLDHELRPDA